jgi:hypothetical protein
MGGQKERPLLSRFETWLEAQEKTDLESCGKGLDGLIKILKC